MRVAFTGGRNYTDNGSVATVLALLSHDNVEVLHGDAKGLDTLVRKIADRMYLDAEPFFADWDKHGRAAGPIRNREMVATADLLIAFPGGKGTEDCIRAAKERGIPVLRLEEGEQNV